MSEAKGQARSLWAGRRAGGVKSTGRALGPLHLRLWLRRTRPLVQVRLQVGCSWRQLRHGDWAIHWGVPLGSLPMGGRGRAGLD